MTNFRAIAKNAQGATFQFHFQNANWNDIENVANANLQRIVSADACHKKFAPWFATQIDVE